MLQSLLPHPGWKVVTRCSLGVKELYEAVHNSQMDALAVVSITGKEEAVRLQDLQAIPGPMRGCHLCQSL